jgi:hypothetical protein
MIALRITLTALCGFGGATSYVLASGGAWPMPRDLRAAGAVLLVAAYFIAPRT